MRALAAISLVVATVSGRAEAELVYVAVGASVDSAGGARAGAPAQIARRLERAGTRVRLVDLTAPDATVRALREEQLPRAMAARPRLVTVAVGTSDVRAGTSLRGFSRDLQIVADLLHRTEATVVISTLPRARWLRDRPDGAFRRRVDAFNWAILRIARRYGFTVADVRVRRGAPQSWEAAVASAIEGVLAPARTPPRPARRPPVPSNGPASSPGPLVRAPDVPRDAPESAG